MSIYKLGRSRYTITSRKGKKFNWYPIIGNMTEAVYTMNRIGNCLDNNRRFIVTKRGDKLGERVITDPTILEDAMLTQQILTSDKDNDNG